MKYKINSKKHYHETMVKIYEWMNKGEQNLSPEELVELSEMTNAAELYEDNILNLNFRKEPETISDWVERALFEHKMTQTSLATALGLPQSKVSEILSGKRKPDVPFLKGLHKVLKADPEFLLEHA
jgi:antitoxin component HigA of HigAB toxin-antitoxin module